MDVHTNIPLQKYTTMQVGGTARFITDIHTKEEVATAYKNAASQSLPVFILGGGSNTLARDGNYNGLVMRMQIPGFTVIEDALNDTTIRIGAGENWDAVVQKTVDMRLSGIEAMSAIPGTAGAAPIQNVGAYGQEIADTLIELTAYDTETDQFVILQAAECGFSYRNSIFRGGMQGRYIITDITLKLSKTPLSPPFYATLQSYLDSREITLYTQQIIRDAVTAIRATKLPDPAKTPNTGSFFKNAIVEAWKLEDLKKAHPDIPSYDMGNGMFKIPSGWLIEKAGLKGTLHHGIRVYPHNALVLVNEATTQYSDLAKAREEIIDAVRDMFGIIIEQEPLELS